MNEPKIAKLKRPSRASVEAAFSAQLARTEDRLLVALGALRQCAAPFTIKPADQADIDWEGLAREFYRRMALAKEALQHGQ